ncbi:DUF4468 domain-containing protein [Algoriphagus limi]|uniref:DUF4468 domain-containing protein n=1 Tax=Algoriphagus limi TaxID=2975273 RepID=A0ABT2G209_9BACT|nr:DUF4468 domain-containing protein [Algoriphagus limi]MCS5489303.1 DUF4468 domain-containing protein [Algoriphagus limi]
MKNKNLEKMKNVYLLFLAFFISFSAFSQEEFEYVLIDSLDQSKEELYSKARSFMAYSFKDSKSVIQMDDKEIGRIIGKGNITLNTKTGISKYPNILNFTITIDVRENRYRCIINEIYHDGLRNQNGFVGGLLTNEKPDCGYILLTRNAWRDIKEDAPKLFEEFLKEFQSHMNSKSKVDDF